MDDLPTQIRAKMEAAGLGPAAAEDRDADLESDLPVVRPGW